MRRLKNDEIQHIIERAKTASYLPTLRKSIPVLRSGMTTTGNSSEGCNVENASYGLTICAERNAVFHMVAKGKSKISVVAIYTPTLRPTTSLRSLSAGDKNASLA